MPKWWKGRSQKKAMMKQKGSWVFHNTVKGRSPLRISVKKNTKKKTVFKPKERGGLFKNLHEKPPSQRDVAPSSEAGRILIRVPTQSSISLTGGVKEGRMGEKLYSIKTHSGMRHVMGDKGYLKRKKFRKHN